MVPVTTERVPKAVADARAEPAEAARPPGLPHRGFTLIELLIVIGIIGLLISILVPSLARAHSLALRATCTNNLRQIHLAFGIYAGDHDEKYPCAADPVSASPFYWLWMGRGWRGLLSPYLGGKLTADNPLALFCQADMIAKNKYESTSYAYSMAFYHSSAQIDAMNSAAQTYSSPVPSVAQRVQNVAHPAGKVLVAEWTSNHCRIADDKGWWTWEGERNYLFAGGEVVYLPAARIAPARDGLPDPNLTFGGIAGQDVAGN